MEPEGSREGLEVSLVEISSDEERMLLSSCHALQAGVLCPVAQRIRKRRLKDDDIAWRGGIRL